MLSSLLHGFTVVFQPYNLLMLAVGSLGGLLAGATPGISGVMVVALLLPVTYVMDPVPAFLLLTAIYVSAVYSGSISAILFRIPGAPEAVATTLDGYQMTLKGKAPLALGVCVTSSALGGLFATIVLILVAPQLARVALQFGPPEYFALAVMGMSVVSTLGGGNQLKAIIMAVLGLLVAVVGLDPLSGTPRFTFGRIELMSGIDFIPVLIGLFAMSEVLRQVQVSHVSRTLKEKVKTEFPSFRMLRAMWATLLRSSVIGTFIGILPGVGATTAAMVGYSEAVRWSKHPQTFGTGEPEGVAAPESANNAGAVGAMVPLLSLGIPGSATTAILVGAFILHGMQPGPLLMRDQPVLVYSIFAGLLLCNFLIIVLSRGFIPYFAKVLQVPYRILGPIIALLTILGAYAIRNQLFDVWVMLICGILGYILERYRFPLAPLVLGVVLGGIAETSFRRSMILFDGSVLPFFSRPICAALLGLAVLSFLVPLVRDALAAWRLRQQAGTAERS